MFTGIIEATGIVESVHKNEGNARLCISCPLAPELLAGQSIAHNGVCLTVTNVKKDRYNVIAVEETLIRSNLGALKAGDVVNLERAVKVTARFDGHFVQGHIDETAACEAVEKKRGSYLFTLKLNLPSRFIVFKGSVAINGVSLTVACIDNSSFSVAVIPHTYKSTNFSFIRPGDRANVEFDILGKYVANMCARSTAGN